jgi:hypothetical protein
MPQAGIDFVQLELFRIEFAADPVEILIVLFMVGVADRRQKIRVAAGAAAILGRAGARAAETARIPDTGRLKLPGISCSQPSPKSYS